MEFLLLQNEIFHLEVGSTLFKIPRKKAVELPALFGDLRQQSL